MVNISVLCAEREEHLNIHLHIQSDQNRFVSIYDVSVEQSPDMAVLMRRLM